ncbi:hypothetical protein JI435_423030 [Parastagonospora nodorum SN15]|uniref:Uncharacterized protein n=1 Tax=Phaeosphaeria nodorum (strain SN15 / ATCC MYA-4574 / FGSC 10173) TaxID=321614 RepID=A0A7U2IA27_PHANO|nr:hypothetical protein JI435_423030 [Parastagonospora nodorum SN15]
MCNQFITNNTATARLAASISEHQRRPQCTRTVPSSTHIHHHGPNPSVQRPCP